MSTPLQGPINRNPKLGLSPVLTRSPISDVYSRAGNAPGNTNRAYLDDIHLSK